MIFETPPARHLALMLHDGCRFTNQPLTDEQWEDLQRGLLMIALDKVTDENVGEFFGEMLQHKWVTTAPFDPEFLTKLLRQAREGAEDDNE